MKKVAICFYGQPRKYKKVLDQWRAIIDELNADVFISTWHGIDRGKHQIDINELILDFNPKEIRVSNPHKFTNLIPSDATYQNQSYHAMQQAYTISNVINLMDAYSKDLYKTYDVVIKCRMDIELHNIINLINFIDNFNSQRELYVAGNHWQGHLEFDDNIMVGSMEMIKTISSQFYQYTIDFINKTKMIPGGEQNIFYYANSINFINNIKKINALDFNLLTYANSEEIILNQNENS